MIPSQTRYKKNYFNRKHLLLEHCDCPKKPSVYLICKTATIVLK